MSENLIDRANAIVDELLGREELCPEEERTLDALSGLIERHERDTMPPGPVSDGDMLAHILDARGLSQAELARRAGIAATTISAVIAGRRRLTREHIQRLAGKLGIRPGVFFGEPQDGGTRT